jgi:hypothetical protein
VPDDARWDLLSRWRDPAGLAEAALAAAMDPARDARARTAIGKFCARHDLRPDGAIERALFYSLTGQSAQHQAADPDGTLLSAAYQAADEPVRAALRQEMAGAGDLDLIQVIAAGRDPAVPVTSPEQEYLAAELARRRNWPALWALALKSPVAAAPSVARLLDPGWRPDDEAGRELLARLTGLKRDLMPPRGRLMTAVRIEVPGDFVRAGSFSPDGRRLALLAGQSASAAGPVSSWCACELDLPHGALLAREDYPGSKPPAAIVHLGRAILLPDLATPGGLELLAGGRLTELTDFPGPIEVLAHHGEGFAAMQMRPLAVGPGQDMPRADRLLLCDRQGRVQWAEELRLGSAGFVGSSSLAADPGSGRIAVCNGQGVRVYGPSGDQIAGWATDGIQGLCFLGSGHLAAVCRDPASPRVEIWQASGQLVHRRLLAGTDHRGAWLANIVAVPDRQAIAVRLTMEESVRYFGSQSLAEIPAPTGRSGLRGSTPHRSPDGRAHAVLSVLCGSPDGRAHAVSGEGFVNIAFESHPLTSLARQSMGEMARGELASVTGALAAGDQFPAMRPLLETLRACLQYRFGSDIALGQSRSQATPMSGPDDIALSDVPPSATGGDG